MKREFVMDLTPRGLLSSVVLDGEDISSLLRGVVVRSDVGEGTSVELIPMIGCRVKLTARLPEARIVIAQEPADEHHG